MAWLVGAGETAQALALVEQLVPFADRLRFGPRPTVTETLDPGAVFRETVGKASGSLASRRPNERVAAQREATMVWSPFADELLALWLETVVDGAVGVETPPGWADRGAALLERYVALAALHTRCSKHRNPKENLAILRSALHEVLDGGTLSPRRWGLLQHAVDAMVRRRGRPGSSEHRALRTAQSAEAAQPTHHALARLVVTRLAELPQDRGASDVEPLVGPVGDREAQHSGVPAGTPIPPAIAAVVRRTLTGSPERLLEEGVVPSAEVLAGLVPRIAATTVAQAYADERLRALMAATHEAFRRRRSLLLLDLERQVRVDELPWVQAVAPHRSVATDESRAAVVRLAELTLAAFPATLVPNQMVTELDALAREAGLGLPLVEELAADIFMGAFSAKFLRAAQLAGRLLEGSLYARYFSIDYAAVVTIDDVRERLHAAPSSPAFDALCRERAGPAAWRSVAANGMVIEQAQILTTHNLAALTGPFGVGELMGLDASALATRCLDRVLILAGRLEANPQPLRTVKDLAYAWRQMLFFLSRVEHPELHAFTARAADRLDAQAGRVVERVRPVLDGLSHVVAGGHFAPDGTAAGSARRLVGWAVDGHWMLAERGRRAPRRSG